MVAFSFAAASCSHNLTTDMPTAPTTVTAVRAAKLTVTPPGGGSMLVGTVVPLTTSGPLPTTGLALGAFVQYTDGTGKYVDATWTSSDSNVAVVRDGNFVAVGRGTVTMTATAEGLSGAETFTVDPGIPGLWTGTYIVDTCRAGSASVDEMVCAVPSPGHPGGFLRPGTSAPMAMQINQTGKDLTAATQFGELRGVLTGVDAGGNYLSLKGTLNVNQTNVNIVVFNARVQQDVMQGAFGYEIRITGLPSWAVVTAHFDNVARH